MRRRGGALGLVLQPSYEIQEAYYFFLLWVMKIHDFICALEMALTVCFFSISFSDRQFYFVHIWSFFFVSMAKVIVAMDM